MPDDFGALSSLVRGVCFENARDFSDSAHENFHPGGAHCAVLCSLAPHAGGVPGFIGTQAGGKSAARGIYQMDLDTATGALTGPKLAAEYDHPGFLVLHPSKPVLLAVGRPSKPFDDKTDSVAAFAVGADQSLRFLGEASSGGAGLYRLVDPSGKQSRWPITTTAGSRRYPSMKTECRSVVWSVRNAGAGPNAARQEGPHAHGVYFDAGPVAVGAGSRAGPCMSHRVSRRACGFSGPHGAAAFQTGCRPPA